MSSSEGIWCECGCRITVHHVLQHGFVMNSWVPRFVFVKYRCPACTKVGQELMEFQSWSPSVLDASLVEPTPNERVTFDSLGAIREGEVTEFGRLLRVLSGAELERTLGD